MLRLLLPWRGAFLGMYAKVVGFRLGFLVDVVAAVAAGSPCHSEPDHGATQVLAIGPAYRDRAAITIGALGLTNHGLVLDQHLQHGGCNEPGRELAAPLLALWRVDAPKAIGRAVQLDRIARGYCLSGNRRRHGRQRNKRHHNFQSAHSAPERPSHRSRLQTWAWSRG